MENSKDVESKISRHDDFQEKVQLNRKREGGGENSLTFSLCGSVRLTLFYPGTQYAEF